MDKTDLQIMKELLLDTRKPFREIAKKLDISTQTVIRRYKEMKEKGIIQNCAISINANKIGYEGIAHLLITSAQGNTLSETIDILRKTENIIIATRAIGDYEGYAVMVFKNAKDFYEKLRKIKFMPWVETIDLSFTVPIPPTALPITGEKNDKSSTEELNDKIFFKKKTFQKEMGR
jgi:DNA-binding Lrp family transcriptional regulator